MPNEAPSEIAPLSFLVIEDEEFSRAALTQTLGAMGAVDVATAANGIEALAHLVESTPPDVMLVDINMPKMGGADLLRHLAERHYPGAIILVSGADKDTITVAEGLAKYRELNVLGHIVKPMTPNALSGLLAKLE